jgi:hypothetical protein
VRSPIPGRDGGTTTPRNSPPILNLALNTDASAGLYHFDGKFESLEQLRDLGDSAPYLHNGSKASLEEVVAFYRTVSAEARGWSPWATA